MSEKKSQNHFHFLSRAPPSSASSSLSPLSPSTTAQQSTLGQHVTTTVSPNASTNQWIEIIEPKSKVQMFANLHTGECRWDEPRGPGNTISRATNPALTQWWELYDANSQRFYYYCAKDSKTVWRRPQTPDAIVVPLAKLQILKQNTSSTTHKNSNTTTTASADDQNVNWRTADVWTQTEPEFYRGLIQCSRSTQTCEQTSSSYLNENCFRNPSLKHYLISEARLTHAMRIGTPLVRETDITQDFDYDPNDDDFDDVLDDSDLSCDADDEYDCDYSDDDLTDDELDDRNDRQTTSRYVNDRRDDECDTEDDIRRRRDDRYEEQNVSKGRDRQQINSLFAVSQTSPTGSHCSDVQSFAPTKSHSLTQISSNSIRNKSQNISNTNNKRLTTLTTPSTTASQTLTHIRPQTPPNSRQISHTLSLLPESRQSSSGVTEVKPKSQREREEKQKTSLLSIESFAKENIERHRKLFFGKKVSLKAMLEWSKKSIKKPMISSISDQKLRNESKLMFKFVQKFMRDVTDTTALTTGGGHERQPLSMSEDNEMALYLLTTATQQPILRDELLVQIARQTTNNPSKDSELRGLRLMCCCFWYFPPSHKLAPHLNAFLSSHVNAFARDVVKRKFEQQLRRSLQSHVVYVRKPHDLEEVSRVLRCVDNGFVGVFGESLGDALLDQRVIPWPIVSLTEALLKCRGSDETTGSENTCCEREGVFRCVGDLDEVMRLKIKMDTMITCGTTSPDSVHALDINLDDIHVIASALKLYFRELKEPLIPFDFYWEALDSAHDFKRAQQLVERMPAINKFSLAYLIRFLQVFSAPEHVVYTKMDDANLSMVWAPNVLRSDTQTANSAIADQSLSNIFERTRSEMSFVRTLIQNLDTGFMSGVQ